VNTATQILLAGLPSSGKTTFLAALWYVLTNPGSDSQGLRIRNYSSDRRYLNSVKEQWMNCCQVDRTLRNERPQSVRIPLVDSFGEELDVIVPDLSGEVFREVWEARVWPSKLEELLSLSLGTLLFIHPDHRFGSSSIDEATRLTDALVSLDGNPLTNQETLNPVSPTEFSAADVSDTVQLVDILQCIADLRGGTPAPTAVIVSAWDMVPHMYSAPENFLEAAAPLLHQYLTSQSHLASVRYWGVSAQGGSYETELDKLIEVDNPVERIILIGSDLKPTHDLTAPLCWLLSESPVS